MWSLCVSFFFFKQKTAYEMRISDWSSDVCSSDLAVRRQHGDRIVEPRDRDLLELVVALVAHLVGQRVDAAVFGDVEVMMAATEIAPDDVRILVEPGYAIAPGCVAVRSEEHTSELQSLMRISYAVFCLKKKTNNNQITPITHKDT